MTSTTSHTTVPYITVDQACKLIAISRSTFYRLLNDPLTGLDKFVIRLPGIQRLRVPQERFVQWLEGGPTIRGRKRRKTT